MCRVDGARLKLKADGLVCLGRFELGVLHGCIEVLGSALDPLIAEIVGEIGYSYGGQDAYDGYGYHQFNKGKTLCLNRHVHMTEGG